MITRRSLFAAIAGAAATPVVPEAKPAGPIYRIMTAEQIHPLLLDTVVRYQNLKMVEVINNGVLNNSMYANFPGCTITDHDDGSIQLDFSEEPA